jgi:hypothetical protein
LGVQLRSLIFRLLAILAIAGFLTAPMAMPSRAGAPADVRMATMPGAASMADAMPCCPGEQPVLPDCSKSCPMAILCTATCLPAALSASAYIPVRFAVASVRALSNDNQRPVLSGSPPLRPPKA